MGDDAAVLVLVLVVVLLALWCWCCLCELLVSPEDACVSFGGSVVVHRGRTGSPCREGQSGRQEEGGDEDVGSGAGTWRGVGVVFWCCGAVVAAAAEVMVIVPVGS